MIIVILALILAFIIYKFGTRNSDYWEKRNVAHPKPLPFVGNYADLVLLRKSISFVSCDLYNQFPDKQYVGAILANQPVLVMRDPDLIKLIMTKDFYYFYGRGLFQANRKEPITFNLFFLSGDYWRVLRQNLTPLFSSAKMKNMFYLMAQCGQEFEDLLRRNHAKSVEFDVRETMSRFSMDVIGSCAFGLQMNSLSGEDTQFRQVGFKLLTPTAFRNIRAFFKLSFPKLLWFVPLIDGSVQNFFVELFKKVVKMREGRPPERHDFIDLLTELRRSGHIDGDSIENMKPGAERRVISLKTDDHLLVGQSFVFFVAGFETSSTTMSYALYELAMNPDIQARVHAEIDSLLGKYDGKITYDMLQEAHYLDKVSSETLRKYPVLATITRECTSRYTMPDGLVVEPGVKIHLPVYALQHDPQYYPNPDVFDPERFSPEASRDRNPYTYMPFGEGQRLCIGMRFGKMQVLVGLISLLKSYSVEPCARTEKKIIFEPKLNITTPKKKIYLKLVPRTIN